MIGDILSENKTLSSSDVARLLQDPSPENRANTASKIGKVFSSESLTDREQELIETIFRAMLKDAAVRVRTALSESLADNPEVPHDIARELALDIEEVAIPMLQSSSVLTDEDLVEIIKTRGEGEQYAVTQREKISETVADALVETDNEKVVASLVSNDGAIISESTLEKVVEKFGDNEFVSEPLSKRRVLPLKIAERLVTMVSEEIRQHILNRKDISTAIANDLVLEAREKATVSMLGSGRVGQDIPGLVKQLYDNGRLSPTLIIRALCMGDELFFETALAHMTGIPSINIYRLTHEGKEAGLKKLFERAGIPEHFLKIAHAALSLIEETVKTCGDDQKLFRTLMIERVLTTLEDDMDIDSESVDYLISKLNRGGNAAHV